MWRFPLPRRTSKAGSELFIVDNSDEDWKVKRYLHEWCSLSKSIDVASGYFEIGSLLALDGEWQKVDSIRILMGDEISKRTKKAFLAGLGTIQERLNSSLESEKEKNDFLAGTDDIVGALKAGKIRCRIYRKDKFHAKCYITHARQDVVGSFALVGSSNFTVPGLTENVELNVQISGTPVSVLQEWYEQHWDDAEDVTAEILQIVERHTREYSPFDVYAKSLQELHRRLEISDRTFLEKKSRVYPKLDKYQRDGFQNLLGIAEKYNGALLCDGVGLGKTFIGLMLLEYLIEHKRKRVALFVPKAAREPVWNRVLKDHAPHLFGAFQHLEVFNHTDLSREGDIQERLATIKERADVVVIDEAHHFRNLGFKGTGEGIQITREKERAPSRYYRLLELIGDTKQVFMLTATPVNNRLTDFQHLVELFSRGKPDHFKTIGVHSLPGHIRKLEKSLSAKAEPDELLTDLHEASTLLSQDNLFRAVVVQRSRAFVRASQALHGGSLATFPERVPPQVAKYSVKKTYGKLLVMVEQAFHKTNPLFTLAPYDPYTYPKSKNTEENLSHDERFEAGRLKQVITLIRTQFLKRFESSPFAFEMSCIRLLQKLLAFTKRFSTRKPDLDKINKWERRSADLIDYATKRLRELFDVSDDEADEDFVSDEMLEMFDDLDATMFDIPEMLDVTRDDLEELVLFIKELKQFDSGHDDKLQALIRLLKTESVLQSHKVLIFTEFGETAIYLARELKKAGIEGVAQVDSSTKGDRTTILRQFAPYYNGVSSVWLKEKGLSETRVLISTDVLSEGLNLQDATRLINYDLHWNPVRLMQRIGRVDRRLDPAIEQKILADHPDRAPLRGQIAYWNFLPPDELNALLSLFKTVTHKTLRISQTFGIEGRKLLTPDDDYQALKEFNNEYEGTLSESERLETEYDQLLKDHPGLAAKLDALPGRVFSGKPHPQAGTSAVFFCYRLPRPDPDDSTGATWTEAAGETKWFLVPLPDGPILDDPTSIADVVRSTPETPRHCVLPAQTLAEVRKRVEGHIHNTWLKKMDAPVSVKPALKAWMELN